MIIVPCQLSTGTTKSKNKNEELWQTKQALALIPRFNFCGELVMRVQP
jgi:outer membrane biogenesis lipoprotein LolB